MYISFLVYIMLKINQISIDTDKDGYLLNLSDWNRRSRFTDCSTRQFKADACIWEVIYFVRSFYQEYHLSSNLLLVKAIAQLGQEKGNSRYLQKLFTQVNQTGYKTCWIANKNV